jgi:hypothetical protein
MQNTYHSLTNVLLLLALPALLCLSACNPPAPDGQAPSASESSNRVVLEPDVKRLVDLQTLAGAIADYQAARGELPADFQTLVVSGILEEVPMDPIGINYDYTILGDSDYELCARFERNSSNEQSGDFWYHRSGHHCFRLNPVFGQF